MTKPEPTPADLQRAPIEVERVTMAEIARRLVALGIEEKMSPQRVLKLAETDPDFPLAGEQRVGRYRLVPWAPVLEYFKQRNRRPGPKGWSPRASREQGP